MKSWISAIILCTLIYSFKEFQDYFEERPKFFPPPYSSTNNPTHLGYDLGRHLFYDPILSIDSSISCASCHQQSSAFSDNLRFSKGVNDNLTSRNSMPLFNLAWYPKMFWDGRAKTIEEQVLHPVRHSKEMGLNWLEAEKRISKSPFYKQKFKKAFGDAKIDSFLIAKSIAQFERALISANSKYDSVLRGQAYFTAKELAGFNHVNDQTKGNCLHCHTTDGNALGTTGKFSNNGLDTAMLHISFKDKGLGGNNNILSDYGKFKIPSLRNLLYTAPYMHDGRFNTLEEVLDFYSEGINQSITVDSKIANVLNGGQHLTNKEKQEIIAFLKTLSDDSFVKNKKFSNPFK
ncbi:MAG: cytochrome-c peroxidase [Flavobacteriales bacterium]|nr:cytochrome-c peroxidase [Flavobacteriales bacterium]|tara:strand:- start:80 stop:1120 length:1041 start_codon:yes stop_codon:yes gene_type:complete